MIARHLKKALVVRARQYPVITLTGPRQSGKTTLVRDAFPRHAYVSLEHPEERAFALDDPRGFLNRFPDPVILDEVQRVPDLLSYIQVSVDENDRAGRFVLTGSQNFLLMEKVSQSLAGRTALFHLLPLSRSELAGRAPLPLADVGRKIPKRTDPSERLVDVLFKGFYPRIHDKGLPPQEWLRNYYQTYVERDVRTLVHVGDLETFGRFVRLCAGRSGQILNASSLGADCGISHATARRWLSVLEASFIIYLLRPYYENFGKRLIKSPKLYFMDTGLLCYLLRIRSADDLISHALRGAVFETFVVVELLKAFLHQGLDPDVYYWRDSTGHEIDLLHAWGPTRIPIEAKSGETAASDFFKGIEYWRSLPGQGDTPAALVYGGDSSMHRNKAVLYRWSDWL